MKHFMCRNNLEQQIIDSHAYFREFFSNYKKNGIFEIQNYFFAVNILELYSSSAEVKYMTVERYSSFIFRMSSFLKSLDEQS